MLTEHGLIGILFGILFGMSVMAFIQEDYLPAVVFLIISGLIMFYIFRSSRNNNVEKNRNNVIKLQQ